jgi:hypothetical protein
LTRGVLTIEDEIDPHGRVEDLTALNALYAPVAIAGVNRPQAIPAEEDE